MSFRKKIKLKIQSLLDRLSGEHSEAAPENITPYEKGSPDENIEVVMARIERPGAAKNKKNIVSKEHKK
jgi:hypothetical protein